MLEVVSGSPGWPQSLYVAKDDLEFLNFLPLPPECWDYRCAPLQLTALSPQPAFIHVFLLTGLFFLINHLDTTLEKEISHSAHQTQGARDALMFSSVKWG